MKKWIKRVTLFVVGLALVLGAYAGWAYWQARGTPDWLRPMTATAEEQAAAANRLDQKILDALSAVREWDAADPSQSRPVAARGDRRPAATQPFTTLKVSFSEAELNASFRKWDKLYGWTERYRSYVREPSIVLHEGKIIVAGKSDEVGSVVSIHFDPKISKDGNLDLELSDILAGRLSLPQWSVQKYRTSARNKLKEVLPGLQRKAEFRPDGSANSEAMSAAMAKLFLRVLDDQPGEPVVFLPVGNQRSVPVRLTAVDIEDKELTLTVKPLNAKERLTVLEQIRERYDNETALNEMPGDPHREPRRGS
jgi:hypothetical protein